MYGGDGTSMSVIGLSKLNGINLNNGIVKSKKLICYIILQYTRNIIVSDSHK